MVKINQTHDPKLKSWVASANNDGADFPIQNLPFGVFKRQGSDENFRGGVAIGDKILDLAAAKDKGLFDGLALDAAEAARGPTLNPLMALGHVHWTVLRGRLSELLAEGGPSADLEAALIPQADAEMTVPAAIGDFTDFWASINHATNAGSLFRPDNPLLPNYKHIPIGYHGRSSSITVSGAGVKRPMGQLKAPDADAPVFVPAKRLDYEMEAGFYIGPGNAIGETLPLAQAEDHLFGFCLLNDWSARDIQAWEYQPLGPLLGKNFVTTVSPWIITLEALAPFRSRNFRRPEGDPQPLDYLADKANDDWGGIDFTLEVSIRTAAMRGAGDAAYRLGRSKFRDMYWTVFQMIAHHASNGCNLRPGDLMGSGTVSGTTDDSYGSLLEVTQGGANPFTLPNGETRSYLEDGDEIIMGGRAEGSGYVGIGFGECRAIVEAADG